jgi:hypothetical protein
MSAGRVWRSRGVETACLSHLAAAVFLAGVGCGAGAPAVSEAPASSGAGPTLVTPAPPAAQTPPPPPPTSPPEPAPAVAASAAAAPPAAPSAASALTTSSTPPPPPAPLAVPGARACTPDERTQEWCVEGRRAGECMAGLCITPARCNAYCTALAAVESPCAGDSPMDCAGNAECLANERAVAQACRAGERSIQDLCRRSTCERLRQMPVPP